jgi:hypothetical protein
MANVSGLNDFNNLLNKTKLRILADRLERRAGKVPLDLSFKGYDRTMRVLTSKASQINGKNASIKYKPFEIHSRPYLNHEAGFDPTILNAVRNKFVNVSGLLIPNKNLRRKTDTNITQKPLTPVGIVQNRFVVDKILNLFDD